MSDDFSPGNRIRIEVEYDTCIGSGDCVDTAAKVFALDENDKAIVLDPDAESVDLIVEAASNCPIAAIFVVGEEGALYP